LTLRTTLWPLAAVALLAGCDWVKSALDIPPPVPSKHPTHDLVIREGRAYYNEKFIGPGLLLSEMEQELGPPTRPGGWYDLGITVLIDYRREKLEERVHALYVHLEPEKDPEEHTIHAFPGRALLDGAALYGDVSINHVNYQLQSNCRSGHGAGLREGARVGSYQCKLQPNGPTYWADVRYGDRRVGMIKIGIELDSSLMPPLPSGSTAAP
jgi:hypothetical protein